jgi:hypothetical protein
MGKIVHCHVKMPNEYPENNSMSIIRIFNLKCFTSKALSDFLPMNSNNTRNESEPELGRIYQKL